MGFARERGCIDRFQRVGSAGVAARVRGEAIDVVNQPGGRVCRAGQAACHADRPRRRRSMRCLGRDRPRSRPANRPLLSPTLPITAVPATSPSASKLDRRAVAVGIGHKRRLKHAVVDWRRMVTLPTASWSSARPARSCRRSRRVVDCSRTDRRNRRGSEKMPPCPGEFLPAASPRGPDGRRRGRTEPTSAHRRPDRHSRRRPVPLRVSTRPGLGSSAASPRR